MGAYKSTARAIGILFIIASAAAIVGGTLALPATEADFLSEAALCCLHRKGPLLRELFHSLLRKGHALKVAPSRRFSGLSGYRRGYGDNPLLGLHVCEALDHFDGERGEEHRLPVGADEVKVHHEGGLVHAGVDRAGRGGPTISKKRPGP